MGHLGLTPQSIYQFGTYKVRAKEDAEAEKLLNDAKILEKLGCFALVLEKIPASLAKKVSESINIPTTNTHPMEPRIKLSNVIFFLSIIFFFYRVYTFCSSSPRARR